MNFDFSNAAAELGNPLVGGVVAAVVLIGAWKGAKALVKYVRTENERKAKQSARLERARATVTPIEFPPPRP